MKKGRIIKEDSDFKPQYYSFFIWWDFTYDNVIGGCDLGLSSSKFSSYHNAFKFLIKKGFDILDEKNQKILNLKYNINSLEKELEV